MVRRTPKNVERATKIIVQKGYPLDEANMIALQCFDNCEQGHNGMPVEWYLDKIIPYEQWLEEYGTPGMSGMSGM